MRKIYSVIAVLFLSTIIFAQDDKGKNPNVELPDFVITGSDIVTIQKGQKIEPDIKPILDEKFFKPRYSPEDLEIGDLSDPVRDQFSLSDSLNYFSGKLEAQAGFYSLPKINFSLASPFENGIFQITAAGKNRRAYVTNSEQYYLNSGINIFYQLESETKLFNGTKFQFHGDYGRQSYKLFAANDAFIKRNLNKGNIALTIENLLEEKFNYSLSFSNDIHSFQDNIYAENFLNLGGMLRANVDKFHFGFNSNYKIQYLKNDLIRDGYSDFSSIRPYIGYSHENILKGSVGLNFSNFMDKNKIYPYVFLAVKLNEQLSLFTEYSPQVVFYESGHFLDINPYFDVNKFSKLVQEKKNSLQLSIKYDYNKYYELNGGIKYFSSDNSPYYKSSLTKGRFDIASASAKSYTGFINLLFHLGPLGYFYGSVDLNETKMTDGKILPYHPALNSYLTYGYNFEMGLNSEVTLNYQSKQFTDISNSNSVNPFVNLTMNFIYKISPDFNLTAELNNLLNRKNYLWKDYQEPPLDIGAGIIYRW
jgi:hypothetical protein